MQISPAMKLVGALAIGAGAAVALTACTRGGGGSSQGGGPASELTDGFISSLHPEPLRGAKKLSLATDSTHTYRGDDGRIQGTMDGTRLLKAADEHRYGTPEITDAAVDVKGDGFATFNEVRQVVRHFDVDASNGFDADEGRAFEAEVGIQWLAGR